MHYDLSEENQVSVKVYGKILDKKFTFILHEHPELDLETIYLLDQVQKGRQIPDDARIYLRRNHLVEGRKGHVYLAADVAARIDESTQYVRNKAFDDQYYKDLIVRYLEEYEKAKRSVIKDLLWDKLPDGLTDQQKNTKISTLLTALRKKGVIEQDTDNQQKGQWRLVKR